MRVELKPVSAETFAKAWDDVGPGKVYGMPVMYDTELLKLALFPLPASDVTFEATWRDGPVQGSLTLLLIERAMLTMGMRRGTASSDVNPVAGNPIRRDAERALEQAHAAVSTYWKYLTE